MHVQTNVSPKYRLIAHSSIDVAAYLGDLFLLHYFFFGFAHLALYLYKICFMICSLTIVRVKEPGSLHVTKRSQVLLRILYIYLFMARGVGACMAGGDMRGRGACVAGEGCAWQKRWPLQRTIRILLECILVTLVLNRGVHVNSKSIQTLERD